MKKVLIILIGNIKYDGRVLKTIKSLQKLGLVVELLTSEFDPDDKFENYNFQIYHIPRKPRGGLFLQIIRNLFFYIKARNVIKKANPDYIHCNDLSSTFYVFGFFNRRVIYDSHELALEGLTGMRKWMLSIIEKKVVKKSYRIILPQIDRLNIFYFKYSNYISKDKLFLIENYPNMKLKYNESFFYDEYNFKCKKGFSIISYTGFLGPERKLEELIKGMASIKHSYLFIIGIGEPNYVKSLQLLIDHLCLSEYVFIKPPLSNEKMLDVAASSNIGVCFYSDFNLNSYFCASNKLYEYLNTGCKVLANNIGGMRNVIEQSVNGYMLSSITEESIVDGVKILLKGPSIVKSNYYWENQETQFYEIYKSNK